MELLGRVGLIWIARDIGLPSCREAEAALPSPRALVNDRPDSGGQATGNLDSRSGTESWIHLLTLHPEAGPSHRDP